MTIDVKQTCNRCAKTRDISTALLTGTAPNLKIASELNGWKDLGENRHICPECILNMLANPSVPDPVDPGPNLLP